MQPLQTFTAAWPALGALALGVAFWAGWTHLPQPDVSSDAEPQFLSGPRPFHCRNCGWIEEKREVSADTLDPSALKTYEYTLRMADGSVSLFRETMPTTWHLGERMTVVEGISPLD
jgi:hypothetical protein